MMSNDLVRKNTDSEKPAAPADNQAAYSVSEISGAVKRTIEGAFDHISVRGEVSRPSRPASGHLYFTLKDDKATLSAVVWKAMVPDLGVQPEEGLEVICSGKLTTFAGQSRYQMLVSRIEIAGEGALLKQLEDRRRRLADEGLFDESRKQPLPVMPRVIAIVTSPTGAVIRDILHRLSERFGVRVLVWPTPVQGQGAEIKIAAAIDGFNQIDGASGLPRPDLIIVARGGGSLEDLWCFNEEVVVRAAAASQIPLISAVGHETDTTLIDFAADKRAPTPTAAAEMAVPVKGELLARLAELDARLHRGLTRKIEQSGQMLVATARGLLHPDEQIARRGQQLDVAMGGLDARLEQMLAGLQLRLARLADQLPLPARQLGEAGQRVTRAAGLAEAIMDRILAKSDQDLSAASRLLAANSFERVLERGFVLVTDRAGQPVKRSAAAPPGAELLLRFADASRHAVLDDPAGEPAKKPGGRHRTGGQKPVPDKGSPRQKDLF